MIGQMVQSFVIGLMTAVVGDYVEVLLRDIKP